MKIVLDLQGAQSNSRHRGIGRYTFAVAKAFLAEAQHHELWIALNGRYPEAADAIIESLADVVPRSRILINDLPAHIAGCHPANQSRSRRAEIIHAAFFNSLNADFVWHSSLFEGWGDDSIAALGSGQDDSRHAATLYDLIPLLHPDRYLHDPSYSSWYYRRLGFLKRCGLLFAISESSRREVIEHMHVNPRRVAVVRGAADEKFRPVLIEEEEWTSWLTRWNLRPGFVLYAGGYDAHKNVNTLIEAYAAIPSIIRQRHGLILAGRCLPEVEQRLRVLARTCGLSEGSVVFTGDITDAELIKLYSHCALFVAPSLHEGFGLPALEAMACGAAVIGSNVTSLPEVIGLPEALFDPYSSSSIAQKIVDVLIDRNMRDRLRTHAVLQAKLFSWKQSAVDALTAIELHVGRAKKTVCSARPRLLYVSPLPPARSGIADYSARLLRELSTHYDIEVVVDQANVTDAWVHGNYPIRSTRWLQSQTDIRVRVLYHVGNSPHHAHMFGLMQQYPGMVVLHDSHLGSVKNWMARQEGKPDNYQLSLYESHGFTALQHDMRYGRDASLDKFPVNLDVIEHALGVIVHSNHAVDLARHHYGHRAAERYQVVPFPKGLKYGDRHFTRRLLGFAAEDFIVCSFGMLAPTKLNHRLLDAWSRSSLAKDVRCHLVFVGENDGGEYGTALLQSIRQAPGFARIHITGFVSEQSYSDYLSAADLAVQLRTASRGETSAAIFDVLAHGLPLVVNEHGSAAELADTVAWKIDDVFHDDLLISALQMLRDQPLARLALQQAALRWMEECHHPEKIAGAYYRAIEHGFNCSLAAETHELVGRVPRAESNANIGAVVTWPYINSFAHGNLPRLDKPRLYVDVTAIAQHGMHTGIERVVRGVLTQLLCSDALSWRVEPVRLEQGRYVHATKYALHLLDHPMVLLPESEVSPRQGDVLLGLDWVADALPASSELLDVWRMRGVKMFFVVYDLLPVRTPAWFPEGIAAMHARWLQCIGRYADGLLCISRSVVKDLRQWYDAHPPLRSTPLPMGYFYPGNDIASTQPTIGLHADAATVLSRLGKSPSFLMVGTIEPRKGHEWVLDAFEHLWKTGDEALLVVVGREGWMAQRVVERLRQAQAGHGRVLWLQRVSDEYLEQIYGAVRALIAASEGEGFGLPLVEAAIRGLPVIARDIPVFREVSSSFATYFESDKLESLIDALRSAIVGKRQASQNQIADASVSWKITTQILCDMLDDAQHMHWLVP